MSALQIQPVVLYSPVYNFLIRPENAATLLPRPYCHGYTSYYVQFISSKAFSTDLQRLDISTVFESFIAHIQVRV